jgi:hypothetical protein
MRRATFGSVTEIAGFAPSAPAAPGLHSQPFWRRHLPLLVLLLAGAALRVVAVVAISPGIWFSDSNGYIRGAATGTLNPTRVAGYTFFVAPFWHAGSALALIVVQHLIGLGIVGLLYGLLVRRGVTPWLAALGAAPAALDAYLVVIEHAVMAETVYHAALVGALALLLWNDRPGRAAALAAGLLLGYAGVTRSVGAPLAAVVLGYLLVRRVGARAVLACSLGGLLLAVGYAGTLAAQHGEFGFTESGGRFLYARVAPFADCAQLRSLPADLRPLCPGPAATLTTNEYLWGRRSPIADLPRGDPRIREFALRVIRHQPLDYASVVGGGVLHYFEPGHRIGMNDYPVGPWQFPADPRVWAYPGYRGPIRAGHPDRMRAHPVTEPNRFVGRFAGMPRFDLSAARVLHDYQRVGYTWGPLLAVCLLLVIAALIARRGAFRLRLDAALLAVLTLVALTVPQALSVFSYRYGFVAALLLPPAAALAVTALRSPRSADAAERPVRTAPSM